MSTAKVLLIVAILTVLTGVVYVLLTPENLKQLSSLSIKLPATPSQNTSLPKAVKAIVTYAALQFNVTENEVKILKSEKQNWSDNCLDIKIPNYKCPKIKLSGYEATVEVNGQKTIYRATADGSLIRVVK